MANAVAFAFRGVGAAALNGRRPGELFLTRASLAGSGLKTSRISFPPGARARRALWKKDTRMRNRADAAWHWWRRRR